MKRHSNTLLFTLGSILVVSSVLFAEQIGDVPAIPVHMKESDIESGRVPLDDVVKYGETLFMALFNRLDGAGRPATTADGKPRTPRPGMLRTTGPDAHSCASCHNRPRPGGGGDFATNVFVIADSATPVKDSISPEFVNERMTVGLFGSGPIEMLAREMTTELHATRMVTINHAFLCSCNVRHISLQKASTSAISSRTATARSTRAEFTVSVVISLCVPSIRTAPPFP